MKLKIKTKLIGSFAVIMLVPSISIGVLSYQASSNKVRSDLMNNAIQNVTLVNNSIKELINAQKQSVDYFTKMLPGTDTPTVRAQVEQFQQLHPELEAAMLGTEKKEFVNAPRKQMPPTFDPRKRPWYQLAMQNKGQVVITQPFVSQGSNSLVVTIAKTTDDGKGVFGVNLKLNTLSNVVQTAHIGQSGNIDIYDTSNHAILSTSFKAGQVAKADWVTKMYNAGTGTEDYVFNGQTKKLTYITNDLTGWKIAGVINSQEISDASLPILYRTLWVAVIALLLGAGFVFLIVRSVTKRKQAEDALRQSEKNYRLIAENMTDMVCVINREGFFKYASPSHVTVLGFPSEAYEGNCARDWMHKDDFPKVRTQLSDMVNTKQSDVLEYRFQDVMGNWIWFEGKTTPIFDDNGHFSHFLIVSREITERRMYEEKLSHMAFYDTLTDLPNRRLFKDRLEGALKEAGRYGRKIAVMYMDMDKFKHINDSLGHDVGDELLKEFFKRVQGCLRESDTLSRVGGDEFTVLLYEIEDEQDALQVAERILTSLNQPWQIRKHVFEITSSIGIAFYPVNGTTRDELVKHADIALYNVKQNGGNNFKTYSSLGYSWNNYR